MDAESQEVIRRRVLQARSIRSPCLAMDNPLNVYDDSDSLVVLPAAATLPAMPGNSDAATRVEGVKTREVDEHDAVNGTRNHRTAHGERAAACAPPIDCGAAIIF